MKDLIVISIKHLKDKVRSLEYDIARAKVGELYDLGLLQGRIVGIEESIHVLDNALLDMLEDDEK